MLTIFNDFRPFPIIREDNLKIVSLFDMIPFASAVTKGNDDDQECKDEEDDSAQENSTQFNSGLIC